MRLTIVISLVVLFSCQLSFSNLTVDGDFNGWEGETVVKLSDGTCWMQSEYYYHYCYRYVPRVELYREYGQIKMLVDGCGSKGVSVTQISCKKDKYPNRLNASPDLQPTGGMFELADMIQAYENSQALNKMERQAPTQTTINVQNLTSKQIFYCYVAYYGSNGWQSNGWYKVDAFSSNQINIGYYSGKVYLYAQYNGGELTWFDPKSKYTFCIDQVNAFNIPNSDNRTCYETNYKRVTMSEFSVSPGVFTWTLNP